MRKELEYFVIKVLYGSVILLQLRKDFGHGKGLPQN